MTLRDPSGRLAANEELPGDAKASADVSLPWEQVKEDRVNETIRPAIEPEGDFASGERTEPKTAEEEREAPFEGDFAAGERTEPQSAEDELEASTHGDFAVGERTEPQSAEEAVPGTFADTTT